MAAKVTIERILRDDDDQSGQTVRSWRIEAEGTFLTIRRSADSEPFLLIRAADISLLSDDMIRARGQALEIATDEDRHSR